MEYEPLLGQGRILSLDIPSEEAASVLSIPPPSKLIYFVDQTDAAEFAQIIDSVTKAIENGILPSRIQKGSSGSYFCRDQAGQIVGVFKPKDEEPYGNQNPKWTKWLHRNLLCCCFGRSCVIPNVGYISEVAASYIDRRLGLGIVPRTELVQLSSPSFNYSFTQRWSHRLFKTPLPTKKGSFQIFVRGYEDSASFFESQPQSSSEWNEDVQAKFQIAFERLVILDYLIRNTDRGSDNWLLRFDKSDVALPEYKSAIQIAAIDNGLAFPIHHPNRIRSYPYGWLSLPIAATPFSIENTRAILHCLMSSRWWQETLNGIEFLFKLDSDFKSSQFKLQRSVMRGQCYNMVECLMKLEENPESPVKLTQMPLVIVHEEELTAWDKIKGKLETLSQIAMFKNC